MQYPLFWAMSVVKQALEKHARVSVKFLEFTGLSPRQLAELLADNRIEWRILRDMLKQADYSVERLKIAPTDVKLFCTVAIYYRRKEPEKMRKYLDNRIKCTRIEEQG